MGINELLHLAAELSTSAFQYISEGNFVEAEELECAADDIIREVALKTGRSQYFVSAEVEELMCEMVA